MNTFHRLTGGLLSGALILCSATAQAGAPPDPCNGAPRCFSAGTFIAEVQQVSATAVTKGVRNQTVSINIRLRNVSDKPLILAYRAKSSAAQDNFGNPYYYGRAGTYDTSVKGIGVLNGREVDTQFALSPGQARSATFTVTRFGVAPPIGEAYNYDLVIDEVEILPGQVVRSARQNSIAFTNLIPGTFAVQGGSTGSGQDPLETAGRVLDLFHRAVKQN